jgi:hypothetical protein
VYNNARSFFSFLRGANLATIQLTEKIEGIAGQLLLVDFKADSDGYYKCRIYTNLDSTNYVNCYFDEELAPLIESAIRKTVGAIGIVLYDADTDKISRFVIKQLIIDEFEAGSSQFDDTVRAALRQYRLANDTVASFKRGWKEVISGETHDISTLWDDFDDE